MSDLRKEVEAFLYHEAALLDGGALRDWLALFREDATYWVPAGTGDYDPREHVSIIHDDMVMLNKRVERLYSGHAYAQVPASRTHRAVSNVEVHQDGDGVVHVDCVTLIIELVRHRQTLNSARIHYRLHREGDGWRIGFKRVNLLRSDEALEATAFLL